MTNATLDVLLGYQKRWLADHAPVKVAEKSRRIGLTWAQAADDALTAARQKGMDVWYVGFNQEMTREYIDTVAYWTRHFQLAAAEMEEVVLADDDKDILAFRIRYASSFQVTALSSRPSNLRGKQGRVVIDEAAFHPELDELLKAALALLMWGGQVVVVSTHNGQVNAFNELVQNIRAGRLPYSLHRITLDDALADGLYRRICLRLNRDWTPDAEAEWRENLITTYGPGADEELFCIPSQGDGVYLTRALIETCLSDELPVLRYEQAAAFATASDDYRHSVVEDWLDVHLRPILDRLDGRRRSYFGEDFGRSGDLTAIVPLVETDQATFQAPFVLELRNIPFRQQEQILFYLVDRLPNFSFGALDARGNGQFLAEVAMQRYGPERIAQVMLAEAWYRDNMPRYKAAFEDRSLVLPRDADLIEDHRAFRVIRGVPKLPEIRKAGRDKQKRHGDVGIAGALAWYAASQEDVATMPVVLSARAPDIGFLRGFRV